MAIVTRAQVVQACLDLHAEPHYLEVGVFKAETFGAIRAARRVAVDPSFAEGVLARHGSLPGVEMHEVTSDAYFGGLIGDSTFDVIYLDGLHVVEQTLRDLLSAILVLREGGLIVIDDVLPDSYHASLPSQRTANAVRRAIGGKSHHWMGDVYRLTYFIDSFLQQFSYRMVADNHGQLVLWRKRREAVTERRLEDVARMPFERVILEPATLRRAPLACIIEEAGRDLGLRPAAGRGDGATEPS